MLRMADLANYSRTRKIEEGLKRYVWSTFRTLNWISESNKFHRVEQARADKGGKVVLLALFREGARRHS